MKIIDAKGQNCPIPVIMAKKEIESSSGDFIVEVDNNTAVQNLQRLSQNQGYKFQVEESQGVYKVLFSKNPETFLIPSIDTKIETAVGNYVIFVGKDFIGDGSKELGNTLMKMFFYALSESSNLPSAVLFMNSGVKLPSCDEQIISHLKALCTKGVDILVCGTCINYYELPTELPVGTISNMYDILDLMQKSQKVITL